MCQLATVSSSIEDEQIVIQFQLPQCSPKGTALRLTLTHHGSRPEGTRVVLLRGKL